MALAERDWLDSHWKPLLGLILASEKPLGDEEKKGLGDGRGHFASRPASDMVPYLTVCHDFC